MNITLKKIIYLLILIYSTFCFELIAQNKNWKIIDTRPGYDVHYRNGDYYGLKCTDSLNCMIWNEIGSGGYYFRRSTDGGKSWKNVYTDSAYYIDMTHFKFVPKIQEIAYPNTKLFIAVGDSGLVVCSTDNGESWNQVFLDKKSELSDIQMFDENFGFIRGFYYKNFSTFLLNTTDGGITWVQSNRDVGLSDMNIINRNLICGLQDIGHNDSDYAKLIFIKGNWEEADTLLRPNGTFLVHFIDENQGWVAGGKKVFDSAGWTKYSQLIYRTRNGGKTWEKQWDTIVFNGEPLVDLRFYDKNFGIGTSFLGQVVITTDGGKHWKSEVIDSFPQNDGSAHYVNNIQFLNSTTALVVEDWGLVYKYTREPTDVVDEIKNDDFSISPNPATDFLEISGLNQRFKSLVQENVCNIEIFSVLGLKMISFPCPDDLTPSPSPKERGVRIDVSSLPQGIYFVKVGDRVGKFVKM